MKRHNFNRNWTVKKTSTNLTESTLGNSAPIKEFPVTLPHDAMVSESRSAANPAGVACGFYAGGDYEYKKIFHVEKADAGQTFILEFEGIYNRGYVYINGALAGSTHYGYTGTFLDITPYLYFDADNVILVKAINSDVPNSRWYTGSGIYRPVYLYKGGPVRVEADGLRVSTPEISTRLAAVKVETAIRYDGKNQKTVTVKTEILDASGNLAAEETSKASLFDMAKTVQTQRIYVKEPTLWSVEHPHLYRCRVAICDGEDILDTAETTFGIRKLELNPMDGLKLNGESVLLRGGCIHHDNGPVGAATFDRAEERRIELLKEAGFNSVRISHNSSSKALLDACDRLGMLVMEESYDTWTQAKSQFDSSLVFENNWEKDIEDIVHKDFNHPSVFMYSIGNEITDLGTSNGAKWSRRLADKFRELDPTRYVTNAINSLVTLLDDIPTVMVDLGLISPKQLQVMAGGTQDDSHVTADTGNDMSAAANAESPAADDGTAGGGINDVMTSLLGQMNYLSTHPNVEKALNEAYGTLDLIGMNYMRDAYGQMKDYPNRIFYGSETLPPDIDLNWKKVKEYPACIGDYTWTAWDYIGEAGVGIVTYDGNLVFSKGYPAYLAYCGDLDITGYRRPMSYLREIVFGLRKTPYVAVQLPEHYGQTPMCTPWSLPTSISTWTWNGFEGKPCKVEVYSDAPEVELFINGKSVGKLPAGEEHRFRAVFDTVYEPGEVKAIARYADGATESFCLKTTEKECVLAMKVDNHEIGQDDLAYVAIELTDKNGILQTSTDKKISLEIEGPGCIQGFGSADPWSEENFFDTKRTTYYGRALAVIRAGSENGTIRLSAKAEGLETASVEIKVTNA